jgi:hypothetical protein
MNPAMFKDAKKIQLLQNLKRNFSTKNIIQVVALAPWQKDQTNKARIVQV